MFRRLLFLVIYFLAWVVFFEAARVFFLAYEFRFTRLLTAPLILQTFWHGLKMDLSMAAYITLPVCLFVILSIYFFFFRRPLVYKIYTGLILFLQVILLMADVEIFRAWGHRVDYTPINYFSNPAEAWASVSHLPIVWILIGLVIVYILLLWGFRKVIRRHIAKLNSSLLKPLQVIMLLLFLVLLIIPIRGGLQLSPLNHSSVFFSNDQFANHAALNASWNFFESLSHRDEINKNPYEHTSEETSRSLVWPLFESSGSFQQVIDNTAKPNIMIILWESFTEKALHIRIDGKAVAPYFEILKNEGIFFSNCYSSGDRTNKGLSAVLSGYPALPKNSIINYPQKLSGLDGLGKIFRKNGYDNWFYYGGEPEFANMKGYILDQQFNHIITKHDFSKKDQNSKWGAHDDVVMNKIIDDSRIYQQPFFTTFLTLTSHEPFETPVPTVFHGKSFSTRLMNTIHYTDSCLFVMIQKMKKEPWWDKTIVIIVADHGHYEPATGERADDYRIPMLWLGGALIKKGIEINTSVSQLDIAKTLLNQVHMDSSPFVFSKDLFDSSSKKWAFFTFNDGIGLVTDSSRMIYDNAGQKVVYEQGRTGVGQAMIAKALMQMVYADFLKR